MSTLTIVLLLVLCNRQCLQATDEEENDNEDENGRGGFQIAAHLLF